MPSPRLLDVLGAAELVPSTPSTPVEDESTVQPPSQSRHEARLREQARLDALRAQQQRVAARTSQSRVPRMKGNAAMRGRR